MNLNGMRLRSGLTHPALILDYPELTDPVRDVHTNKVFRVRRRHYSVKNQRYMDCESRGEKIFCMLSDVDRSILAYRSQPRTVKLIVNGRESLYTPDFFYLTRDAERWYVEVKDDEGSLDEDEVAKSQAFAAWCQRHGYHYRMAFRTKMEEGCRLKNAELLLHDKCLEISADELIRAVSFVGYEGKSAIDVARHFGVPDAVAFQHLRCMTLFEHLSVDLDAPLTKQSLFTRPP